MILFIYGSESYLVREKLDQVVDRAREQKIDDTNTARLDGLDATPQAVQQAITAAPFLAEQRLVIISDWLISRPAADSEALAEALEATPETTIAVVVEGGEPDKRRTGFKRLEKLATKSWHFAAVEDSVAVRYISRFAKEAGAKLAPGAANHLVQQVGTDLWTLKTEISKLATGHDTVTRELVDELVTPNVEGNIFVLVDELGKRNLNGALPELHKLLEAGEPSLRLLAMVIRQFRLLIGIQALAERGAKDAQIAKDVGVRPFLVPKLKRQAQRFTPGELRELYEKLRQVDQDMKTSSRDPETVLQLFVTEVCAVETTSPRTGSGQASRAS